MLGVDELLDRCVAVLNGLDQLLDDHYEDLEDLVVQVTLLPLCDCNAAERLPKTHEINNMTGVAKLGLLDIDGVGMMENIGQMRRSG